jgi:CspA family cold shock protein
MNIKDILKKLKNIFRGNTRNNEFFGKVKFFDRKKGFGFIISGNHEYFFHAGSTKTTEHRILQDGVSVKFNLIQGKKGPQADNVEVL